MGDAWVPKSLDGGKTLLNAHNHFCVWPEIKFLFSFFKLVSHLDFGMYWLFTMENWSQLMQYSIIDLLAIIYLCLLIVSIDGFEIDFFFPF